MKNKIYCKETNYGKLSFYVRVDNKDYFLFSQDFKKSVSDYFSLGVSIDESNDYSLGHGVAVRKVLDKLPSYVRYVEKEFNLAIYNKTKREKSYKKTTGYKRDNFKWQDYALAM